MRNIPIGLDPAGGGAVIGQHCISRPISRHSYWLLECRQECEERLREREGRKDDNTNIQKDLRDYFSEREISPVKIVQRLKGERDI